MKNFLVTIILIAFSISIAKADISVQSCDRSVTFDKVPERAISNDVNLT